MAQCNTAGNGRSITTWSLFLLQLRYTLVVIICKYNDIRTYLLNLNKLNNGKNVSKYYRNINNSPPLLIPYFKEIINSNKDVLFQSYNLGTKNICDCVKCVLLPNSSVEKLFLNRDLQVYYREKDIIYRLAVGGFL